MAEFNEDGSIKLPEKFEQIAKEKRNKFKTQRCILIRREIVSDITPKKCVLRITLSDVFNNNDFVENTYKYFLGSSEVPTKLEKINEKEFVIEIGTCFRRCSDCNSLVKRFRDYLEENLIEEKGSCTFEHRTQNFSYEDYFD